MVAVLRKRKVNPVAYVSDLASGLQGKIESGDMKGLIVKVAGVGPYLNLFVDRARVFRLTSTPSRRAGTSSGTPTRPVGSASSSSTRAPTRTRPFTSATSATS